MPICSTARFVIRNRDKEYHLKTPAWLSLSAFTSRYPEAVKELIVSDVTRGPAVVSMKESNRNV
ncbi:MULTISPECIES: hypothetical protein [Peribacillus]|uniref:hypothetical protein n=1 Tax=Peribacillus TaxID=2675229 RepID=UPI001F4D76C3|nr:MULTISPECIES: hypothetical protein [unclassified Peribacillus]MCK1983281.1 hypothetical protein [Peribacillus sp. Aquil_B1]MCK2006298.1 hypothetical protein [Peribacillus sp. Aquil_B8]